MWTSRHLQRSLINILMRMATPRCSGATLAPLKTGALVPAMAARNASTLLFSVVFGIVVFDERLVHRGGRVGFATAVLTIAVVGVVRLRDEGSRCDFDVRRREWADRLGGRLIVSRSCGRV